MKHEMAFRQIKEKKKIVFWPRRIRHYDSDNQIWVIASRIGNPYSIVIKGYAKFGEKKVRIEW